MLTTDTTGIASAADRLSRARTTGRPCAPVRDLLGLGDVAAAYEVQQRWVRERIAAAGVRIVGHKIGLTHPRVQAQLGVDQPDFGILFDDMRCPAGESIATTRLLQPRIEAEIAFVLAADLAGDPGTDPIGRAEVAAATGAIHAALEIVDSRIAGWDIGIVDTVADNASAGLFVLAPGSRPLGDLDLAGCEMTLRRGGEVVSTGRGAECLGDPLEALAWLARTVRALGQPLRAGDIVLSGALGPMVPVRPGDRFAATITGLGDVEAHFAGGAA